MNSKDITHIKDCFDNITFQLEELLYMIGDAPEKPTEDQLMNYVIGMIQSTMIKEQRLCSTRDNYIPSESKVS